MSFIISIYDIPAWHYCSFGKYFRTVSSDYDGMTKKSERGAGPGHKNCIHTDSKAFTMEDKKKIAILTEEGFEQIELTSPKETLEAAGFDTVIIAPGKEKLKAWNHTDWGIEVDVDIQLADANPDDYEALILPGGVLNPDKLRENQEAVAFVKAFLESGKTVAAICHGPQTLIETGLLEGRKMTSYSSVKTDLMNAGALWTDEEVVHDGNLITSRKPDDLPAFNKKIIDVLQEQPTAGIP